MINKFRGKYYFLSNFYDFPVRYQGLEYLNAEAAFQAQKTLNQNIKENFCGLTPDQAKRKGRHIQLRSDWEKVKDKIMYEIVFNKFAYDAVMKNRLLDTGEELLEEGNTWRDYYWGTCNGRGKNKLGHILMQVREELKNNDADSI